MSKKRLVSLGILVAMLAHTSANAAGAAGIVFDPTNFAKNLITALQTAKTAAESASQTVHQANIYVNAVKNLKQNTASFLLSKVDPALGDSLRDFTKFYGSLKELETSIDDLQKRFEVKAKAAWDEKMTVADFVKWQQKQAEDGVKAAQLSIDSDVATLKRVDKSYALVRDLQEKIPGIEGSVQGLQLLNTQMNALVGQNAELVTVLTRQNMAKTLSEQNQADDTRLNRAAADRAMAKSAEDVAALGKKRKADFDDAIKADRFKAPK